MLTISGGNSILERHFGKWGLNEVLRPTYQISVKFFDLSLNSIQILHFFGKKFSCSRNTLSKAVFWGRGSKCPFSGLLLLRPIGFFSINNFVWHWRKRKKIQICGMHKCKKQPKQKIKWKASAVFGRREGGQGSGQFGKCCMNAKQSLLTSPPSKEPHSMPDSNHIFFYKHK